MAKFENHEVIIVNPDYEKEYRLSKLFFEDDVMGWVDNPDSMSTRLEVLRQERSARIKREQRNERNRFNYKCRKQKAQAEVVGLRSWGVVGNRAATLQQYVAIEQLFQQADCLAEVLIPFFPEEECGWRLRSPTGSQLVSVYAPDVPDVLALTRSEPERITLLLKMGSVSQESWCLERLKALSPFSNAGLRATMEGEKWLRVVDTRLASRCDYKVFRYLARVPEVLRWSLVRKHVGPKFTGKDVSLADLDWSLYKQAKVSPAIRLSTLPPVVQWRKLFGTAPLQGLSLCPLDGFKVGVFRQLAPMMGLDAQNGFVGNLGNAQALFNLVRLFGDTAAIKRFVASRGFAWTPKGIHDAGQFQFSNRTGWTPSKWAPLCLKYPELVNRAADFHKLEAASVMPQTLVEFRRAVLKLGYPHVKQGFEALAEQCLEAGLPGDAFSVHQEFWGEVQVKKAEFLPQVVIEGPEVGLPEGWRFFKLHANDYRGPMLGELTGCCQHLTGAGNASAEHGVRSPYSAFYVVTHNKQVMAQSWAWINSVGGLVFDSIESKNRVTAELAPVFVLFAEASKRVLKAPLGIPSVFVGDTDSGITGQYLSYIQAGRKKKLPQPVSHPPVDAGGYYDGSLHIRIEGKAVRTQCKMPAVEGYTNSTDYDEEIPLDGRAFRNIRAFMDMNDIDMETAVELWGPDVFDRHNQY